MIGEHLETLKIKCRTCSTKLEKRILDFENYKETIIFCPKCQVEVELEENFNFRNKKKYKREKRKREDLEF